MYCFFKQHVQFIFLILNKPLKLIKLKETIGSKEHLIVSTNLLEREVNFFLKTDIY